VRQVQPRTQAYKMIEAEIVNDQVFSQFIYKIIPDKVHMWMFKKQLNTQMALSGAQLLCPVI
jgi:transformation/transcription domain-associated protein